MQMPPDCEVFERPELHRFELEIDRGVATAYYRKDGNRLVLTHTEVPQELAGRGVGSRLAKGVFEIVRMTDRKVILKCSFMAGWYARHPEYGDVVDG